MPLNKSKGNMYPWVTDTHAHLGGECPHKCTYCYVNSFRQRVPKYQGKLRLIEKELEVNYGEGKTIFIEYCNDLFAEKVPYLFIERIMQHCSKYDGNIYVLQTKNPERFWFNYELKTFPERILLGVTIETNRDILNISNSPPTYRRMLSMESANGYVEPRRFVTIEPILDFDIDILAEWIQRMKPDFVNIGADSKGHGLPEPTMEKVQALIDKLTEYGIEIREKSNLDRLKKRLKPFKCSNGLREGNHEDKVY